MKMFIHERGIFGVRLLAVASDQTIGWDCATNDEIDSMLASVKAELDRAAERMKAALEIPCDVFPDRGHSAP